MHRVALFWRRLFVFSVLTVIALSSVGWGKAAAAGVAWIPAATGSVGGVNAAFAGNNVAGVRGVAAVLLNPAGLAEVQHRQAQVTRLNPIAHTVLESVVVALPTGKGNWGLAMQQFSADNLVSRNEDGSVLGSFNYNEGSATMAWATQQGPFSLGGGVGALWQAAGVEASTGWMGLAGAQWRLAAAWEAGVAAKWRRPAESGSWSAPEVRAGVSYRMPSGSVYLGAFNNSAGLGMEWHPAEKLAVRGALTRYDESLAPSFGIGLKGVAAQVDYAYSRSYNDDLPVASGMGHVLSLQFTF